MRAVVCDSFDGIDALTCVEDAPPPPMVDGGVRLRVEVVNVNDPQHLVEGRSPLPEYGA